VNAEIAELKKTVSSLQREQLTNEMRLESVEKRTESFLFADR
jgi:hypothetical protein